MAIFADFARSENFLLEAFTVYVDRLQIVTATATRVELRNPSSGVTTFLTGTGLAGPVVNGTPTIAGTMTGFEIRVPDGTGDAVTFQASGIAWSAVEFLGAARDAAMPGGGDFTRLDALFSLQPITYDARSAVKGVDFGFPGVTSAFTMVGSDHADTLWGGLGNDQINPGTSPGIDVIVASGGSDTFDLRGIGPDSWAALDYGVLDGPVQIVLDGASDIGRITKTRVGTDTILGVRHTMEALSFDLYGTIGNDTFTLNTVTTGGSYLFAAGGYGDDTFDLTLNSRVRLGYGGGGGGTGIVANLATGVIQDGLGGTDRISIRGGTVALELSASDGNDSVTGSDRAEVFYLRTGSDTVLAGAGNDTIHGGGNHTEISGEAGDDVLYSGGYGGFLSGGTGNDTIHSRGGEQVFGGAGDDWVLIDAAPNGVYVDTGPGLDRVEFTASGDTANPYAQPSVLLYKTLAGASAITVVIDGTGAGGSGITSSLGRTDLRMVQNGLAGAGLSVFATGLGDRFEVTLDKGQTFKIAPGRGQDAIRATGSGTLSLEYSFDPDGGVAAIQGLVANLATGVVANDGFGQAETLQLGEGLGLVIQATGQNDRITGSARDERFVVSEGWDTLHGGGGSDTLDYSGFYDSSVRIDLAAGNAQTIRNGGYGQNRQFLSGIENVQGMSGDDALSGTRGANVLDGAGGNDMIFGDGFRAGYRVPSALDQSDDVYRVYLAMLDRVPDVAGHGYWTLFLLQNGYGVQKVAEEFLRSREFQNTYGTLDDRAFVTLLYQNVLDRAPDAAGLADWLRLMSVGLSRAGVVTGFSESTEFFYSTQTAAYAFAQAGVEQWSDAIFRLYRATLDRAPDAAGFFDWQDRLAGAMPFLTAVAGFTGSREFQRTYGTLDDTAFITLLYRNVLDRDPDAGGLADWLGRMAGGLSRAGVVEGFAQSREFVASTAADVIDFMRALGGGDRITGGWASRINGGSGTNDLWGGNLADTFVFWAGEYGRQVIHDFEAWDFLGFQGFGYDDPGDVRAHLTQSGLDVTFDDQSATVTLRNTTLAELTDDMFIFS